MASSLGDILMVLSSLKRALLAGALLSAPIVLSMPAIAVAQTVYTVPREPLGDALSQLAQASGRNILFSPATVEGKTSAPVSGVRDFETALRAMIGGAGVSYSIGADGSVVIRPGHAAAPAPRRRRPAAAEAGEGAPEGSTEVDRVVVEGRRIPRAVVTELAADNTISVITAADISAHPDHNVAETLARLPGVNVMFSTQSQAGSQGNGTNYGGLDTAARAEGQFVSLRAMDGEYNVNLINGVDVAQGMPYSREVELSLLPPVGLNDIVVNKTSTADMDGDAIGGTIDFRMPTAYDYKGLHVGAYVSGGYEDRASQYGLPDTGYTAQIEGSNTFGANDQFGVYLSGYYADRDFANSEQTYQSGEVEYQTVTADKTVPAGMSPDHDLQLMSLNMQMARGETKRYGFNGSFDWRPNDNFSAYVRGTYAHSQTNETVYQLGVQGDRTDNGGFAKAESIGDGLYRVVSTQTELHYWAESNPSLDSLSTVQVGGTGRFGRLTVSPMAYYSYGENDFPNHFEVTFYNRADDPGGDNTNPNYQRFPTGFQVGYNGLYPVPIFGPGVLSNIAQIGAWPARNGGEVTNGLSHQSKEGVKVDFAYEADAGPLKTIKFGAKYSSADRYTAFRDFESDAAVAKGTTLDGSGLVDVTLGSIIPGIYDFAMPLVDPNRFWAAFNRNGGFNHTWSPDDYNGSTVSGTETVASAYALAQFEFGDVEVMPGVRFEDSGVRDTYWISGNNGVDKDGTHYGWASSRSHFDEVLPSLFVTWRPGQRTVYRAGIWTSYTRPPFIELAGNSSTSVDSDGNVHISKGNPDLKAIQAQNVDLSGTWANTFGGAATVALFYKHLEHYIYDGGGSFSTVDVSTGAQTTISQPFNGGDGQVYGIELDGRQMFTRLPGWWSGFGVSGNATFQASQAHLNNPLLSSTEQMQNAPNTLLNASLLYEKYGIAADLAYHYASDYIHSYGLWGTTSFGSPFNSSSLDQWVHAHQQLDLSVAYTLPRGVQLQFSVSNLTDEVTYYDTIGRHSSAAPEIIEGGRVYQFSAHYSF